MDERRSLEASGNTIAEATENALAELGASREEVEIQILSQGGRRLLGFGTQEARVRATLRPPESEEEVALVAKEVLERLLGAMGLEARVSLRPADLPEEPTPIALDITGQNLGILIGRRGETLRALQYITRLIVYRRLHQWAEIIVDVEGYKKRREGSLTQLARRMADRATLLGQAVSLEPMPPHERRIIHLTLRDHEKVTTESVGEGDHRKVVIFPRGHTAP
jgi:spoIIIJ-associated protein